MAVSRLWLLILIILIPSVIICAGIKAVFAVDDEFPYLTNGQAYISKDFHGIDTRNSQTLNATDHYYIQTIFRNADQETRSFPEVYFVVMVTDQDGYAQFVGMNTYGEKVWSANQSNLFSFQWNPQNPGRYTIKSFLISSVDTPQILTSVETFNVTVVDKVDKLGVGEENYRLHVESIDSSNNSVSIVYSYCDETAPYRHNTNATLYARDYVSINAADAYFMGLEDGKAVFRFVTNGGIDACLL
jgi:hypothetical protein